MRARTRAFRFLFVVIGSVPRTSRGARPPLMTTRRRVTLPHPRTKPLCLGGDHAGGGRSRFGGGGRRGQKIGRRRAGGQARTTAIARIAAFEATIVTNRRTRHEPPNLPVEKPPDADP